MSNKVSFFFLYQTICDIFLYFINEINMKWKYLRNNPKELFDLSVFLKASKKEICQVHAFLL